MVFDSVFSHITKDITKICGCKRMNAKEYKRIGKVESSLNPCVAMVERMKT